MPQIIPTISPYWSYTVSPNFIGIVIRARDLENYELVWFMPNAEEEKTVAYVPVAHGIVPWWTEAYQKQEKGIYPLPQNDWFRARVDVLKDEFTVQIGGEEIFTKKLTYNLHQGTPGLYVGTATDAAFRNIQISPIS